MNKKALIALFVLLIILAFGVGFLLWKSVKRAEMEKQAVLQQQKQAEEAKKLEEERQNQQPKIDISDWKTYRNDEFRFEVNLPGNLDNWKIEKKQFLLEGSAHKNSYVTTLSFNYDLDLPILHDKNDPSSGFIKNMYIWYINITPIKSWKPDMCKFYNRDGGPCFQGAELGRNESYVFETGFQNVEGVGYLCAEQSNNQEMLCGVFNEFINNVKEKFGFKLLEQ